ncbi:TIGR03435 family protein [Peijinzhouia sedimentorum]
MKLLLTFLFVSFQFFSFAQSKIGTQVPDISFEEVLNYSSNDLQLSEIEGKVIILDFWATWCAPCIASFPKLEEIQEKYKSELQIITITSDSNERILKFLENRDMNLPIAIDPSRKIVEYFPHRSIPHTVVIDKNGIVQAVTNSSNITQELVQKVIDKQTINLIEKIDDLAFDPAVPLSGNENFAFQVTITPFREGAPSFSNTSGGEGPYKNRRIITTNLTARTLYELAYQFPTRTRTVIEISNPSSLAWNKENAICFEIIVPEELGSQRFEMMQKQLDMYFGFETLITQREMEVYVLERIPNREHNLKLSDKNTPNEKSYSGAGLKMTNNKIDYLASYLENQLDLPVIDETNLLENYDLEIPWYNENPDQIFAELEKLGLQLQKITRKIDVLLLKDK